MASTTGTGISSEELRTIRYQYVVTKYGQRVLCEIFRANFLMNNSKSISEQLKDIEIYNKTKKTLERIDSAFKKWFNACEFEKIDKNEPLEGFDITLLFKIFHKFWDNKVKEPSEELKVLVKKVKDERNAISHEGLIFTQSELRDKLKEFETTLHEALDEAAKLYPSNGASFVALRSEISKDIASIQEKIRENLDPLDPEDIKKFKEELETFRHQLKIDIQERSISDLISICERIRTIQPFDWLPQYIITDPSNIMVSLQMDTDKALHAVQSGNQPLTVNHNDILTTKEPSGGNPEVVIISGDAGAGKTTLLSFLLEKWSKKEYDVFSDLSSYDILLHMEFRSHDVDSFDAYIKDRLKELVADYDIQNVKQAILKLRGLIICDGFDEKNEKSLNLFKDILKLKFSKVIITTRPMHTSEVTGIVNSAGAKRLNLSLLGITKEHQLSLIEKLMHYLKPHDITERENILKEIKSNFPSINPHMKELLRNPLFLSLYVVIWVECPEVRNSIDTLTKLFSVLRKEILKRLKEKLETNKVVVQDEALPQFERFYHNYSLKSHLQQYYELTDKDIKAFEEKCNENGLPFESVMSTYFSVKPSRKGLDIVNIWCYRHRSEQEFGAASAICDRILEIDDKGAAAYGGNIISHILSSISREIRDEEGGKRNKGEATHGGGDEDETFKKGIQSILRYVTGILNEKDETILEKYISNILDMVHLEEDKYDYLIIDPILQHLSEAQNNSKVIESAKRKLEDKKVKRWAIKDGKNLSSLPNLLSEIKPTQLQLELGYDDQETFPGLIPSVCAANTNSVRLEVHLWKNFVTGGGTDLSKKVLQGGGISLKEFKGSICPEGLSLLPEGIEDLHLYVQNKETLVGLSNTLPSLNKLETLWLRIPFKELMETSIKFTGKNLSIQIDMKDEKGGDDKAPVVAEKLNVLWPKEEKEPATFIQSLSLSSIMISNSQFTKTGIEEMITSLKMKGLNSIDIYGVKVKIPKEEKKRLSDMAKSTGLTKELDILDY